MQEIKFTKEDEYCIRNFGYNTVGDYENLKQLEDKEHLIVEELEYRLQQKENIKKEVREYIEKYDFITGYYEYNYDDGNDTYTHYTVKEELLEILDKENKGE